MVISVILNPCDFMLSLLLLMCEVVFALSIFSGYMWHLANCVVVNWKGLWLCVNAYLSNMVLIELKRHLPMNEKWGKA